MASGIGKREPLSAAIIYLRAPLSCKKLPCLGADNRAFVAMQYYGYLRRTPEPDGYIAWLTYLNAHPTDFREMVRGFVDSIEYRRRFGTP